MRHSNPAVTDRYLHGLDGVLTNVWDKYKNGAFNDLVDIDKRANVWYNGGIKRLQAKPSNLWFFNKLTINQNTVFEVMLVYGII